MSGRFQGRRIVITGGNSGIGASAARRIAEEGGKVCVIHRNPSNAASFAEGLPVACIVADVSDEQAVRQAIDQAAEKLGGIDGLVNSAGINTMKAFAETSAADWDRTMAVNLNGAFHVCRAALDLLKQNANATIVNISSALALQPLANRAAYAASKAGLVALSKVLAVELAPSVRVNVVCPGAVHADAARYVSGSRRHCADLRALPVAANGNGGRGRKRRVVSEQQRVELRDRRDVHRRWRPRALLKAGSAIGRPDMPRQLSGTFLCAAARVRQPLVKVNKR
jgi:NAD(P)-dependent dehydrogenase (short-subunit alcohol dehydrogenase family)